MRVKRLLPFFMAFGMLGGIFAGCSDGHTEHTGGTATCTKKAVCSVCGEEYGELAEHDYTAENTDSKYLKAAATTTTKAVYYKSCSVCGLASTTETFEYGELASETQTNISLPEDSKIYVVGDSTVCSFSDNYYLPRYGYGTQLAQYLNVTESQVVNLALSGRSSKSFITETNYTTLTNSIVEGDYLIIGFGHNDEKSDDSARFTDPDGTKDTETTDNGTSFKYVLYNYYVKMAKDKGATPILCTPIARYNSGGDYTGSSAHITDNGDYPAAIKALGTETDTTVIDLTALTVAEYSKDNASAIYYHAHTSYADDVKTKPESGNIYDGTETPSGIDKTHINMYGAKMVAYKFATALKDANCSLKDYVKVGITQPTKKTDYLAAINQDFVKVAYSSFDATKNTAIATTTTTNTILTGTTTVSWYKTAMGNIGGDSVNPFAISYDDDSSKFAITVTGNKGKFSSDSDGFGAAFVQVDVNENFTATTHVKVTKVGANAAKQAGFGIMLRDDIYIDKRNDTLATNYVAAGVLTNNSTAPDVIWSRTSSTAITKSGNSTSALAVDDEYDITLTRQGQVVTCTVTTSAGTTYSETYTDFDFVAVDSDYMYLCLFCNRDLGVEFSNVTFEYTGTSQGA